MFRNQKFSTGQVNLTQKKFCGAEFEPSTLLRIKLRMGEKRRGILLGTNKMIGNRTCLRPKVGAYRSGTVLESPPATHYA